MKKTLFFDFFGVVGNEVSPLWLKINNLEYCLPQIRELVSKRLDLGQINEDEMYEIVSNITGVEPQKIRDDWSSLSKINNEVVNLIELLKKDYNVYLLSNASNTFLRRILSKNNLFPLFDEVFISSELKIAKPNPQFYIEVCRRLNVNPVDCIMIDDNPKNIAGALEVGITGIVFANAEQLTDELKCKYDIKI